LSGTISQPPTNPPAPDATLTGADQDDMFVQQAMLSNQTELSEAVVALQSQNFAVSEFARWMLTDHAMATKQLNALVDQDRLLPRTVTVAPEVVALENLSGSQLATTYINNQVNDHVRGLMQFIQEANTGENEALVSFAKAQIPVLTQHLDEALRIQGAMNGKALFQSDISAIVAQLVPNLPTDAQSFVPTPILNTAPTTLPTTITPSDVSGPIDTSTVPPVMQTMLPAV